MIWWRAVSALALLSLATFCHPQEFPLRPLRMVIAFPPGGPADIVGRHFRQPKEGLGFDNSPVAHMWRAMIWPRNFL